jgi:hypothetical protein
VLPLGELDAGGGERLGDVGDRPLAQLNGAGLNFHDRVARQAGALGQLGDRKVRERPRRRDLFARNLKRHTKGQSRLDFR